MALVDLIASSGSRNFETMRKGWLPTAQETNARKMSELGIQQRQQQIDYEPERQRMAKETSAMNLEYKKSLMQQHKNETAQLKNTTQIKQRNREAKKTGMMYREASKLKTTKERKDFLSQNMDIILPEGTPQQKKDAFNKALSAPDEIFEKQFRNIRQGNTYLQELSQKEFGKTDTYYNPSSKIVSQVSRDSPDYYAEVQELIDDGAVASKKIGIELQGKAGSLGKVKEKSLNKRKDEWVTQQGDMSNTVTGYGELIGLVSSDSFKAGAVGDAISLANSIVQQSKAIFGNDSILKSDGKIDYDLIDKDASFLRELATQDARYSSALMEMAYMKAKSLDKGGKVTDADYRFAKRMLDTGGDKAITVRLLRDQIFRLERNFNNNADLYNDNYGEGKDVFGKINANKLLGWGQYDKQSLANQERDNAMAELDKRDAALAAREQALMEGSR